MAVRAVAVRRPRRAVGVDLAPRPGWWCRWRDDERVRYGPFEGDDHRSRTPDDDVRRRRRLRRREAGSCRDHRVPPRAHPLRGGRSGRTSRGADDRSAGDRQDPARTGRRRRSGRPVPVGHGLVVRRDVRRGRRRAGPRPVRRCPEAGAGDHLRRRDRRHRSAPPERRHGEQRRTRADPQPAPVGDGRIRPCRRDHRPRRDEPARGARRSAPAARPLRPPGDDPAAEPGRPGGHPACALSGQTAVAGHRPRHRRPRDAGVQRCRPGEPRERGRHQGCSRPTLDDQPRRHRGRTRPDPDRPARRLQRAPAGGASGGRRPRGRPCAGRRLQRSRRPGAQGDDPACGHGPRRHPSAPAPRTPPVQRVVPARHARRATGRPGGRTDGVRRGLHRCGQRPRDGDVARDEDGARVRAVARTRSGGVPLGRCPVPHRRARGEHATVR